MAIFRVVYVPQLEIAEVINFLVFNTSVEIQDNSIDVYIDFAFELVWEREVIINLKGDMTVYAQALFLTVTSTATLDMEMVLTI